MAKRTDLKRTTWRPLRSPCNPRPSQLVPGPLRLEGCAPECKSSSVRASKTTDKVTTSPRPLSICGRPSCAAALADSAAVSRSLRGTGRRCWASPPPPGSSCRPRAALRFRRRRGEPGRRARRPAPAGLTCLKQKGMVRTLTPTMLFTTFMISPQLEAAAAVMARGLGPGGPAARP